MPEADRWLADFGASHQQISHAPVFWLAIPILILGTVGILWSLPVPDEFTRISLLLNWGTTFLLAAMVYYFVISLPLAFGMLPFVLALAAFHLWLQMSPFSGMHASLGMFVGGITGVYLGHRGQGGLRSTLDDLQHIMIAPLWVLSRLYRKLGIPH